IKDKNGKPLLSWRVALLPYMEQDMLFKQFRTDELWDSEHNKKLLERMPPWLLRPSSAEGLFAAEQFPRAGAPEEIYRTPFPAPLGFGSAWSEAKPRTLGKMTQGDGTSNTIALVEVDDAHMVPWTKPDDWKVSEERGAKDLFVWPDGYTNVVFFDA